MRVIITMLATLMFLIMTFSPLTVHAKEWSSEDGGEASVTVEVDQPETIAQYNLHTLKLGVKSGVYASATAYGSMYVYGIADATGWVAGIIEWYQKGNLAAGGIGDISSWIHVKFQAIDLTAGGALVEKIILDEHGPWADYGTTRWDYMDIYLVQGHTYKFVLCAEVHAHAFGLGAAVADFGSIWWDDSRIEWMSIEVPNIVEGGEAGCPMLFVWNGTEYFYEGLLNIHSSEGIDVITNHTLISTPRRVNGTYLLRLTEHPLTHSYIDQVKLYAELKYGVVIQLPLVWAWHSEDGNALPQLLFSDEWKAETLGAAFNNGTSQSIDLKFIALPPNFVTGFIFQIEGNNPVLKP